METMKSFFGRINKRAWWIRRKKQTTWMEAFNLSLDCEVVAPGEIIRELYKGVCLSCRNRVGNCKSLPKMRLTHQLQPCVAVDRDGFQCRDFASLPDTAGAADQALNMETKSISKIVDEVIDEESPDDCTPGEYNLINALRNNPPERRYITTCNV